MSLRLHGELESVQKKKAQLEWENVELRERTQDLEVANQVLHNEMDKTREVEHSHLQTGHTHYTLHTTTSQPTDIHRHV